MTRRAAPAALALALLLVPDARATPAEVTLLAAGEVGRVSCGAPVNGWQAPGFDDRAWITPSLTPLDAGVGERAAGLDAGLAPAAFLVGGDDGKGVCTALRERRRFDAPDAARLATLTLRLRYTDGFVAWLNGVAIARSRLDPALAEGALAEEPHGPEPESFYVALPPGLLRVTGDVLALEVRPARATRHTFLDAALTAAEGPRVVRGPYLQDVTPAAASVLFDTDLPVAATVTWSRAGDPRSTTTASLPAAVHHLARLTGLTAATAFHYVITLASEAENRPAAPVAQASFHTPPDDDHPLRVVVTGDVRTGHDVHAAIARAVLAEDPDLVLMTGDLVDTGSDEADWQRYFDVAAPLLAQVPVMPAPGNHEYSRRGQGRARFLSLFLRPGAPSEATAWWSYDRAHVHFVVLDSADYANPAQRDWLERDLRAAREHHARAIFVYCHEGPFSSALHGDNAIATRDYAPLYDRYGVTIAFSGHDHDYERLRVGKTDYVVTGGGGAELRTPRCGVPGRRPCLPRTLAFANEHHYLLLDVGPRAATLCAKRPDGTLLEPCVSYPLKK